MSHHLADHGAHGLRSGLPPHYLSRMRPTRSTRARGSGEGTPPHGFPQGLPQRGAREVYARCCPILAVRTHVVGMPDSRNFGASPCPVECSPSVTRLIILESNTRIPRFSSRGRLARRRPLAGAGRGPGGPGPAQPGPRGEGLGFRGGGPRPASRQSPGVESCGDFPCPGGDSPPPKIRVLAAPQGQPGT